MYTDNKEKLARETEKKIKVERTETEDSIGYILSIIDEIENKLRPVIILNPTEANSDSDDENEITILDSGLKEIKKRLNNLIQSISL
jgi:hypothetical protein